MKLAVVAAAMLLALTTSVHAAPKLSANEIIAACGRPPISSSSAIWDCGKCIIAAAGKGEFAVTMGRGLDDAEPHPPRGNFRWDFRGRPKVWLNGKACKEVN